MPKRETVNVTANYVNAPKQGRRHGSIKSAEFGYISVPEQHLHHFKPRGRYTIIMETTDEGYHNFKGFSQQDDTPPQEQYQGYQERPQRPPAQQVRPAPRQPMLPQRPFVPAGDTQEKMIFITGVVGRAMGSGKFLSSDVHTLTMAAKAAYEQVILGVMPPFDSSSQREQIDPEFDDRPDFGDTAPNSRIPYTGPEEDEVPF